MSVLDSINRSEDVKKLNTDSLGELSDEIRNEIINVINKNGGHLSSNLGITETTVALHYVFDFPKDKLIFDVGHQCYAHKILSDRKDRFYSIRTTGGLSGFPDREESEYDTFTTGHAGSSLASALGLAKARDALGEDYFIICVIGDGAFGNGVNLEALTASTYKPKKFIVVLNDNGMSISLNRGGLYKYMSKRTTGRGYVKTKSAITKIFGNSFITKFLRKVKNFFKRILKGGVAIDEFGFKYVGVIDGNDVKQTVKILNRVKNVAKTKAVFLHVKTTKGKGVASAEERPDLFHGVGKNLVCGGGGFGAVLGDTLNELIEKDNKIIAITAAMKDGTGLKAVEEKHPVNFYDAGIAEEYAVTYAAGLAAGGLKPVVAVYSTFMQRAYDQIIHDVCLQNLPVVFCLDRAGLVGEDGRTHQGTLDISYLTSIPNITVYTPATAEELKDALNLALSLGTPAAIRYPKSFAKTETEFLPISECPWQTLSRGKKITVLAEGPAMLKLATEFAAEMKKGTVGVVNVRRVKPLDEIALETLRGGVIFTLEENALAGGFGSEVAAYFSNDRKTAVYRFGVKDEFIRHGSISSQLEENGLTTENLVRVANQI